jgi:hypothetical protein
MNISLISRLYSLEQGRSSLRQKRGHYSDNDKLHQRGYACAIQLTSMTDTLATARSGITIQKKHHKKAGISRPF